MKGLWIVFIIMCRPLSVIVGPIFKVNAINLIVPSSIMQLIVLHDSLVVDALYQIIRCFFYQRRL